jgi:GGDEF domain-containing protein
MESGEISQFAVIIFDVNGLKAINDTLGHQAGDRLIKEE